MTTITRDAALSAQFDTDTYHFHPGAAIKWGSDRGRHRCDECGALQYETAGHHQVKPARHRRSNGATTLLLCELHAEAWKSRDAGMRGN
ncbi:hypothetical protein GOEFS_119_00070 [Gordonia effusa NBRC 100432]|uniref:Uncharacterized protein n=1 Tax=Gordonia effusa NBRC 100432 TaxID=1077974 RepID=H0R616_9ACTN|nr:hypothetical protein GOEFS_119_00070 [Gordonia effusa NBRC 100432]